LVRHEKPPQALHWGNLVLFSCKSICLAQALHLYTPHGTSLPVVNLSPDIIPFLPGIAYGYSALSSILVVRLASVSVCLMSRCFREYRPKIRAKMRHIENKPIKSFDIN